MTDTKAAAEPSMEEILASIRQIINQSDAPVEEGAEEGSLELSSSTDSIDTFELGEYAAPDGESDPADEAPEDDDILELTAILEEEAPVMTAPEPAPQPQPVYVPETSIPEPVAAAPVPTPMPAYTPPPAPVPVAQTMDELITGSTAMAATAALSGLASSLYQERAGNSLPIGNNNRTLESMVVEAIKPLLKDWCDENLPGIVERVVQAEVEKLTKRISG